MSSTRASSSSTGSGTNTNSGGTSGPGISGKFKMINPAAHFGKLIRSGSWKGYIGDHLWHFARGGKPKFGVPKCKIDLLNFYVVPIALLAIATLITSDIYNLFPEGSEPLECLDITESALSEREKALATEYCQSANTYKPHPVFGTPKRRETRDELEIGYYHWMPLVLLLQAVMFYLPNWVWLLSSDGQEFGQFIHHAKLVNAEEFNAADDESEIGENGTIKKGKFVSLAVNLTERADGHPVTNFYMLIKFLCLLNIVAQFFGTDAFLGHEYRYWGIRVLVALINGQKWTDSSIFPRFTLCDVPMQRFGNNEHVYTFRCFMRINVYIEKLYLFIWWAFLFLFVATALDFMYHTFIPCCTDKHRAVARRLLNRFESPGPGDPDPEQTNEPSIIRCFADRYIREDGVLLLWFVEQQAGVDRAVAICWELYKRFYKKEQPQDVRTENGRRQKLTKKNNNNDRTPTSSTSAEDTSSDIMTNHNTNNSKKDKNVFSRIKLPAGFGKHFNNLFRPRPTKTDQNTV